MIAEEIGRRSRAERSKGAREQGRERGKKIKKGQ